ncbi:hypothetical protein V6N12_028775 [Hibiscus sabdariffa]|uniref:Uncharacterized protein n=1 Tax=Hibiscus sabdariffa TaxID=183260 RepID=A0ABR2F6T4_9ROSI
MADETLLRILRDCPVMKPIWLSFGPPLIGPDFFHITPGLLDFLWCLGGKLLCFDRGAMEPALHLPHLSIGKSFVIQSELWALFEGLCVAKDQGLDRLCVQPANDDAYNLLVSPSP